MTYFLALLFSDLLFRTAFLDLLFQTAFSALLFRIYFFGLLVRICFFRLLFRICFFGLLFWLCFFGLLFRIRCENWNLLLANWCQKLDVRAEQKPQNIISQLITNELAEYQFLHSQLGLISHNRNWHLRVFKPSGKYASIKALSTIDEYAIQDV